LYESLQRQLQVKGGDKAALTIANGFFYSDQLSVKPEFVNRTKQCFETQLEKAPFKADTEAARRQINQWVAEKTVQKIPELFKARTIDATTVSVLANAIYLKAPWLNKFEQTENMPFYKHGREAQTVPFMVQEKRYSYAENDKVQLVELPYEGIAGLSFYVYLPKQRDGLKALDSVITPEQVQTLKSSATQKLVSLKLPKFTIRTPTDLKSVLEKLGIQKIFSNQADFSRLSDAQLKVSSAVHEAYIKINENGTEAAAATGFAIVPETAMLPPNPPVSFVADHPFAFSIVHKPTGAVIFLGRVTSIQQE